MSFCSSLKPIEMPVRVSFVATGLARGPGTQDLLFKGYAIISVLKRYAIILVKRKNLFLLTICKNYYKMEKIIIFIFNFLEVYLHLSEFHISDDEEFFFISRTDHGCCFGFFN